MRDAEAASEAHNLDEGGAIPSPATGGFAQLVQLETWMRERGVRRARMGTLELELGELPSTNETVIAETPEDRQRRARADLRQELNIRYLQVGGWSGTDEELDRMLEGRR